MDKIEFAKKVCDFLEKSSHTYNTVYIFDSLETPESQRQRGRQLLARLAELGVLGKFGYGKFRWRLLDKEYDRTNPYRRNGKPTPPPKPAPEQPKPEPPPMPALERLLSRIDVLEDGLAKLTRETASVRKIEIVIKNHNGKELKHFKERTHPIFEQVMFHVNCGDNVMLVGPKGCGKTYLAEQLADALGRECGIFPISGGVTEGKLFGRLTPNINTGKSEYTETRLVHLIENGGVGLLDEVDAGDPNVLISLNSLLTNGRLTIDRPKKPEVQRHDHFVCLAAANTWGNGADRQYVGRNQLDGAFIERFVQLEMDYDRDLERYLCKGADEMVDRLHKYRDQVIANRLERTISTRLIIRAFNWLQNGKDLDYVDQMIFAGWRADEVRKAKGL